MKLGGKHHEALAKQFGWCLDITVCDVVLDLTETIGAILYINSENGRGLMK